MSKKRSTTRYISRNGTAIDKSGLSLRIGRIVFEALMRAGEADADGVRLTVARATTPVAPARLASTQPVDAAGREQLRDMYERCLQAYRNVVRAQDAALAVDDAGAALAFFVAANMMALHGCDATPEVLQRLERQLIGVARLSSTWESASIADRQIYFETMATIGVLVVGMVERARSEGGAAVDHVRSAARAYLVQLLGLNPDLITLDAAGLSLRPEQDEPHRVAA